MDTIIYLKNPPKQPSIIKKLKKPGKKTERTFFAFMSAFGLAAVIFAIYPMIKWQVSTLPKLTSGLSDSPIPQGQVLSSSSTLGNVQLIEESDGFSYFSTDLKPQGPRPNEYRLTIPKLKIEKAKVKVDSTRFDNSLSHFPGSAIPGDVGNSFVTGHSVLSQFADPENYRSIFTELPNLEIGDEVIVEVEDKKFQFIVQYAKVVNPRDVSVLSPISSSGRNLTLMTCVPPGTNTKRLVVITSLI